MTCAILGCAAQLCLLAAVLCGSTVTVIHYPMSIVGGLLLWVLLSGCELDGGHIRPKHVVYFILD